MEKFSDNFWGHVFGANKLKIPTYKKYDEENETVDGIKIVEKHTFEDKVCGMSICIGVLENGNRAVLKFKAEKEAD
jgi:hypothetical protein